MGMTLTKEEHDRFHRESPSLNPKQHDALMKKLGITKEQDEEWHRTHLTLGEQRTREMMGMKEIHPLTMGGSFLTWCVDQGWVVHRGKQYFATKEGAQQLRERFRIKV
jgi:hypothetical protein